MPEVITWTVAGGSLVFALGLISAIGSRRQRRSRRQVQAPIREQMQQNSTKPDVDGAASMAARGVGSENFATAGNHPS
jgi:hypothetical protein